MALAAARQILSVTEMDCPPSAAIPLVIHPLSEREEAEVLAFLSVRPVHTVIMDGFIRDNGLMSELNRGTFYGCRNREGRLEGVALLGHATLIETRNEAALAAFARFARTCPQAYMILGESDKIATFWSHFAQGTDKPRRICRELLFEQRYPLDQYKPVRGLRLATPDDLPTLLPLYAQLHFEESGVNMLEINPEGFRRRWLRRIEQDRVWVWMQNGRLIFNADIISDTPHCIYLEGIYVCPENRGKGYGMRCFSQLCNDLLRRTESLCLFVNEENQRAPDFYRKAGFRLAGCYDTIFMGWKN